MSAQNATRGRASAATEQPPLAPVLVSFADPAPQSRLTVLFRVFLVIPQLVVVGLAGVAAAVVMLIGWFGALVTGRLPDFAASFLTGYLRWQTRVYAYALLLTGVYPPFTLADADYPVRIAATPGPLNRLAVLFRGFLLVPCWLLQVVLSVGAFTIVQFVSWLIVLISGRMPDALHQGLAAALRYQVRTIGFAAMLTSAYPSELLGEPPLTRRPSAAWTPAPGPFGQAQPPQPGDPAWRLVLSGPAKQLVAGFIVLGSLLLIAMLSVALVTSGVAANSNSKASVASRLAADSAPVSDAINNMPTNVKACKGKLECVTKLDRQVATTLSTFAGQLKTLKMPSKDSAGANAALISSVTKAAGIFEHLGAATTANGYIKDASSANLNGALGQINEDYGQLTSVLGV